MHGTMYPDGWSNCIDRAGVEKEIRPEWKSAKRLKRDHPPAPENIPELVDDQRSEKDSPPQSGGCSSCKKRAENENQRVVFLSAPFLQEHPCFAGLSFSLFHRKMRPMKQGRSTRMRTRRRGKWLPKQPRLGARMCQGTFLFITMTKKLL